MGNFKPIFSMGKFPWMKIDSCASTGRFPSESKLQVLMSQCEFLEIAGLNGKFVFAGECVSMVK